MDSAQIHFQSGLPPCFFKQAAQVYDEAFGAKFSIAIANTADRRCVLESCFLEEFAFVALKDGQLLGLAGYNTSRGALTGGGSLKKLFSQLGFFATLRAVLVFELFERTPNENELVMDGIAVSQASRGMGIGSRLLDCIIEYASEQGYKTIRLDVIDSNPLAKKLYERKGFQPEKTEHYPYLKGLLGFSASTTMVLSL